ncbi:MAG: DUF2480 family protein [Bacteroidetes bacterium]|jgi:hypothetical protein|uniref:DUF2480 family protein n=1 Tax=Methanothrix soehngenii TaxID=2223 RepID=UPI001B51F624|nr:DUF2480 family protein [Bacteroidota bacterium]MBP7257285.1 DUF2480 family protein [Chitinophagales bacterium]MBK7503811.1 DUF2480 family protein [Bacteroidota bacterium]MBK8674118.1 DUF2480 family protein [Bacteroidota bacterium]MBK9354775.1 DUF2480 family protein [Bacteroidota bacterium]
MDILINKVAESGLITLKMEEWVNHEEIIELDIKQFLFRELILKEKEFRQTLKEFDYTFLKDKVVAVYCSNDAILPKWAFMLLVSSVLPYSNKIYFGNKAEVEQKLLLEKINNLDLSKYEGQRIVIKGCGKEEIADFAYLEITKKLQPIVKSLMFGEACSTVPIYKKK